MAHIIKLSSFVRYVVKLDRRVLIMKNKNAKNLCIILAVFSLCSCSSFNKAKENLSTTSKKQSKDITYSVEDLNDYYAFLEGNSVDKIRKEGSNFLYSPLSHFFVNQLENYFNKTSGLTSIQHLASKTNVESGKNFIFSCLPAVASTSPLYDELVQELNNNYVSTFMGTAKELENSLKSFYKRDISISNNGRYFLSEINVDDRPFVPFKDEGKGPFHGEKEYTAKYFSGEGANSYKETDEYQMFDASIYQTVLRILLPKMNHHTKDFDFSLLNQTIDEQKGIEFIIPSFSIKQSVDLSQISDSHEGFMQQSNIFELNRYGVKASSFTIKGPTSTAPIETIKIKIDRPFLFSLSYKSIPLFYGEVNCL